jgi:hypothetical protein
VPWREAEHPEYLKEWEVAARSGEWGTARRGPKSHLLAGRSFSLGIL